MQWQELPTIGSIAVSNASTFFAHTCACHTHQILGQMIAGKKELPGLAVSRLDTRCYASFATICAQIARRTPGLPPGVAGTSTSQTPYSKAGICQVPNFLQAGLA